MKASIILLAVALATAQQFNQGREFNTAVRLAGQGFFQQGGSIASRSSSSSNNNNFQSQNFRSTTTSGDRNFGSPQSFQNNNQFQSESTSFQRNQQNRNQNQFQNQQNRNQNQFQNQQNTFTANAFQQNRGNQLQSTSNVNNFQQSRLQNTFDQRNSQNQFQTSFDSEISRNRLTLLDNVQVTPSARFRSASSQQSSGASFQNNRNQQSQFQPSNFENNFSSNDNNRFSSGRQSQSNAQLRSGPSFSELSSEFDGVFEPLNLPSGASALLGSISTSFNCVERPYGYYADQDNSCRVFHICNPYLFSDGEVQTYQYSFMCGEGTIFDQDEMTCKAEYEATPCQEAANFYFRNEQFGRLEERNF